MTRNEKISGKGTIKHIKKKNYSRFFRNYIFIFIFFLSWYWYFYSYYVPFCYISGVWYNYVFVSVMFLIIVPIFKILLTVSIDCFYLYGRRLGLQSHQKQLLDYFHMSPYYLNHTLKLGKNWILNIFFIERVLGRVKS